MSKIATVSDCRTKSSYTSIHTIFDEFDDNYCPTFSNLVSRTGGTGQNGYGYFYIDGMYDSYGNYTIEDTKCVPINYILDGRYTKANLYTDLKSISIYFYVNSTQVDQWVWYIFNWESGYQIVDTHIVDRQSEVTQIRVDVGSSTPSITSINIGIGFAKHSSGNYFYRNPDSQYPISRLMAFLRGGSITVTK